MWTRKCKRPKRSNSLTALEKPLFPANKKVAPEHATKQSSDIHTINKTAFSYYSRSLWCCRLLAGWSWRTDPKRLEQQTHTDVPDIPQSRWLARCVPAPDPHHHAVIIPAQLQKSRGTNAANFIILPFWTFHCLKSSGAQITG